MQIKNIVITGAGRGIGFALTEQLLAEGHHVYACSRKLGALQNLQKKYPNTCFVHALDLSNQESIDTFVSFLAAQSVLVDGLVHNAGHIVNKPFVDILPQEALMCYQINVLAPYALTQKCLPLLAPDAHVLFISSMGGYQGSQKFAGLTAYSSSKAAVACLTECLQEEFKHTNLTFNCLCLGSVQTEMLEMAFPGYKAALLPQEASVFISQFLLTAYTFIKGKVIPVSSSNP